MKKIDDGKGGGGYKKPKGRSTASKIAGGVANAALGPLTSGGRKAAGKAVGAAGNAAYSAVMAGGKPIGWAVDKAHPYKVVTGVGKALSKITDSKGPPAGSFMSTKPAPKKSTAKKSSGPTKSAMATADRARAVAAAKKTGTASPKKR
jgi:hypothetical protein